MEFECKEIEINDEELGCTLTFCDRKDSQFEGEQTIEEIIDSIGEYVMLQRSYGEDDEEDYHYFEMSESEECGELIDFKIDLEPNKFSMRIGNEKIEISLNISEKLYEEISEALIIITNNRGSLFIQK